MKIQLPFKIRILLLFCFINQIVSAQTNIDSLEKVLKISKIDTVRMDILISLCDETMFSDTTKAIFFSKQLLQEAKATKNNFYKGDAYFSAGLLHTELAKYEDAINYYKTAIAIYKTIKGKRAENNCGRVLINLGRVYYRYGEFETALKNYLQAEKILEKNKDYNRLINLYSNISTLYFKLYQPQKSKIYTNKTIALVDFATTPRYKAACYITYASSLLEENQYIKAEENLKKAENIAIKAQLPEMLFNCYYNMAYMYYKQKEYKKELPFNEKLLKLAKASGSKSDECEALFKLGSCYSHLNNLQEASIILENALKIAIELKSKTTQQEIQETLASLEYKRGNYKKGYELIEQNLELSSEIFSEESQEQINILNAKYQAQKREKEIKQLESDKKLKDLQISKRQQWIYGLLSIIVLLVIITLFIYINFQNKRKIVYQESKLKEQQILQLEKEKQLLATQSVLQGEELERGRIAKDLHDGLGGLLSGVKLSLTNLKGNYVISDTNVDKFDYSLNLLDTAIKEMRRISHNMMPEALVNFGLKDSLQDFCNSVTSNNCPVNFSYYGNTDRLEQTLESNIYRITQELINNALRHAIASEIIVQLVKEDKRIYLTVQDNGKGFDPEKVDTTKSTGLQNIKARVKSLNGRLDIDSKPENGTEIGIEFTIG